MTVKAFRTANLEVHHTTVLSALSGVGKTVATIAAAVGITQEQAESRLSILVDEGLATRTKGSRVTALYAAA